MSKENPAVKSFNIQRRKIMTRTVVALYDDIRHAREAVQDLINRGFTRDMISLVAGDERGEYRKYVESRPGDTGEVVSDTGKGAGIGAVLGGLAGLVVGLGALTIPGLGPLIAAGPLASALAGAGVGAADGGLVGALTGMGIPEDEASRYAEGVRSGGILVTVQAPNERADEAVKILNHHNPMDMKFSGTHTGTSTTRQQPRSTSESGTIPVVEEELQVGKRVVDKGQVRVDKTVHEDHVEKDVHLRDENVEVSRRRVDRPLTDADRDAFREESYEFTEHTEQPIARKDAHVVEEVDIHKDVDEHTETIRDTVRRTDVNVERTGIGDYDEFEPLLRSHFQTTYTDENYRFEDYAPAYRYGYEMRHNDRFHNRSWRDVENDIRRDFERRYPNRAWKEFREAVHQGFEVTSSRKR
jgi:uncharacterized protein (TIGR02271 family)